MSSSLATAQQLKKVHLELGGSDINFLTPCLSSLSHSQSLRELFVECNASGVIAGCAAHTCMHSHTGLPRGILGPRADYEFGAPQFHTQPSAGCHFYTNYR